MRVQHAEVSFTQTVPLKYKLLQFMIVTGGIGSNGERGLLLTFGFPGT